MKTVSVIMKLSFGVPDGENVEEYIADNLVTLQDIKFNIIHALYAPYKEVKMNGKRIGEIVVEVDDGSF